MSNLITPMFMHILLCALLYVFLTLARAPSVWGVGKNKDGSNPFADIQPKVSANLSNQFEWPLFFHVVCALLIALGGSISNSQVFLAWVFFIGRALHSLVQIFTDNIRLRGLVFTINFVAVLAMWLLLFIEQVLG
ncbi:MAG: MAPEG family protein [Pseudomonadota bacterium]|nr:MAPEG family protein [Pseudomonadota bacterium]